MIVFGMFWLFLTMMWYDGNIFGKYIILPLTCVLCVFCIPLYVVEFFLIDIWVMLLMLCSKDSSPKDFIEFALDSELM